jgi:hypothetical protein
MPKMTSRLHHRVSREAAIWPKKLSSLAHASEEIMAGA